MMSALELFVWARDVSEFMNRSHDVMSNLSTIIKVTGSV